MVVCFVQDCRSVQDSGNLLQGLIDAYILSTAAALCSNVTPRCFGLLKGEATRSEYWPFPSSDMRSRSRMCLIEASATYVAAKLATVSRVRMSERGVSIGLGRGHGPKSLMKKQ